MAESDLGLNVVHVCSTDARMGDIDQDFIIGNSRSFGHRFNDFARGSPLVNFELMGAVVSRLNQK